MWPIDSAGTLLWQKTAGGLALGLREESDVPPRTLTRLREHVTLDGRPPREGLFTGTGVLRLGGTQLAHWDGAQLSRITTLCPFELRYLAETGFPHPRAHSGADDSPLTDLHTHFAGCLRPETLLELGALHGLTLNGALLEDAGVRGLTGDVPLTALEPAHLRRLASALCLPADRQSTFRDMERAYRLRGPFTKSLRLFPALLDAVAADYAAMGVRHVELSIGDLYRRDWLVAAIEGAARAQAAHGLTLRFLTALSRHNDAEWDDDLLARLETLGGCRELVGVDWMGHETNSTRAFQARITRLAQWAHVHRPGFVIRVHAGENPAFPENVKLACEAVKGCDVTLRIGHALYGSDEALEQLRSTGAYVELNLTSNFTLNNIHSTAEVPLLQLLSAGVHCVLGTDGPGLYGTTPGDELRAARLAGLTDPQRQALKETEARYLAAAQSSLSLRSGERGRVWTANEFVVPADPPPRAYTPEVAARNAAARDARRAALLARFAELGVEVGASTPSGSIEVAAVHPERSRGPSSFAPGSASLATARDEPGGGPIPPAARVVCIAGAWKQAWASASEQSRRRIITVLEALIAGLPADTLLVTGGTSAGVEGEVHRLAQVHGRRVLATVVEATEVADLGPGPTHAVLLAATPHEKAPKLYGLMKELDALCLFFGGGNVVHDELRAAANLRLRYLALADVDGASGRHARVVPHRAFHSAAEALRRVDDRAFFREAFAPFWHPGVNPTVDVVVLAPLPAAERVEAGAATPPGLNGAGPIRSAKAKSRALLHAQGERVSVLLIRRHDDAAAEPGQWALPGGFVHTHAARGAPFTFDDEQPLDTAVREVEEEAGLALRALRGQFELVAEVEGSGRDERDSPAAWSRTSLFRVTLDEAHARKPIAGGDDASDARWFPLDALPPRLAFDHAKLLALALSRAPRAEPRGPG
ncbi:MAG: NUDIX domain-containing protein [Archangium sp.]|nr:NUDIX domain-containing protein [Archangium sp.]